MIHKLSIALVLADILYIVYCSLYKGMIPIYLLVLLAVFGSLYYFTAAYISEKMVKRVLKDEKAFCVKAGMVSGGGNELLTGVLSVSKGLLLYHVRKNDKGDLKLLWSAEVAEVEEYEIGKIDEYHSGIRLKLKSGEEKKFSSKKLLKQEDEFKRALGWMEN